MGIRLRCLAGAVRRALILSPSGINRMSDSKTSAAPRRHRIVWTVLWVGTLGLMWAGLMMLARRTGRPAMFVMGVLAALVLTYLLTWGWAVAISRARRLT